MSKQINIGILSLQGSVIEHKKALNKIENVNCIEVKTKQTLNEADGIILPGGESTTISKLLKIFDLFELLKAKIQNGMPVWGTCAGMILLAKEVVGEQSHLGLMDITVRRNAYGRQIASFSKNAYIPKISEESIPLVFIRAPWIEKADNSVEILCNLDTHIVAAQQNNMLVTSFHPELTNSSKVHQYFVNMVKGIEL